MNNQSPAAQADDKEIRAGFELCYATDADAPANVTDLGHFTNGWRACIISQLRAPVADGRAAQRPAAGRQYHLLKTDPEVFQAVLDGAKTFEIRMNDRGYAVGDALDLRETKHTGAEMRAGAPLAYTGRECQRFVSHVLTGYGLADGWCCLSFDLPHAGGASAPVAGEAQPVAWFIDWPDEPELGHYIAESPAGYGRSRPLVFADAAPQASEADAAALSTAVDYRRMEDTQVGASEHLAKLAAALGNRDWKWWDSCSFRRLTFADGPDRRDGGALCGWVQPSDGHPDVSMAPGVREFIEAASPKAIAALAAAYMAALPAQPEQS